MDKNAACEHAGLPANSPSREQRFRSLGNRILALPNRERTILEKGQETGKEHLISVSTGEGFQIDITATQFFGPPASSIVSLSRLSTIRAVWTYGEDKRLPVEELQHADLVDPADLYDDRTLTLLEQSVAEAELAFAEDQRQAIISSAVSIAG